MCMLGEACAEGLALSSSAGITAGLAIEPLQFRGDCLTRSIPHRLNSQGPVNLGLLLFIVGAVTMHAHCFGKPPEDSKAAHRVWAPRVALLYLSFWHGVFLVTLSINTSICVHSVSWYSHLSINWSLYWFLKYIYDGLCYLLHSCMNVTEYFQKKMMVRHTQREHTPN